MRKCSTNKYVGVIIGEKINWSGHKNSIWSEADKSWKVSQYKLQKTQITLSLLS